MANASPAAQPDIGCVHGFHWPRIDSRRSARQTSGWLDDPRNVVPGRAEVAAFHRSEDIDDAVDVVVVDNRHGIGARDGADIAQNLLVRAFGEVIGTFCRSCRELMRYCGVCVTML